MNRGVLENFNLVTFGLLLRITIRKAMTDFEGLYQRYALRCASLRCFCPAALVYA